MSGFIPNNSSFSITEPIDSPFKSPFTLDSSFAQGQQPASSLVVIDSNVDNYLQLVEGLDDSSHVLVLNDWQDGIAQITDALGQYQNLTSLHIVSHGGSGQLNLGTSVLTSATLDGYQDDLMAWSAALTETADILLYGCNVADGSNGLAFVNQIGQWTGADVAASTNLTGHATLGADWILEYASGTIEAGSAFQAGIQQGYTSTFNAVLGNVATDDLVMHLTFDQTSGTLATDTSPFGNSNPGTLQNGASFINTGLALAGALQLDGVDDYVAIGNSSDINTSTATQRSVSAWFKVDDVNGNGQKQVIFEEGAGKKGLSIYIDSGQLYVGGWNQSDGWVGTFLSTDAISSDTWHHVSLVLDTDGSNTLQADAFKAYLDGTEFGSGEGVKLTSHGNPTGVGGINSGARFHTGEASGFGSHALGGSIGDLQLYNRALSASEIASLASVLSGGADTIAPTATATVADVTVAGSAVYSFTVDYSDNVGIDAFSLDNNDIVVTGPNGFSQAATLVSTTNGGTSATYQIITPGGDWDFADNGIYEVFLAANQVSDTSGNFALDGSLGTFSVNIPQPGPNGQSVSNDDLVMHLTFDETTGALAADTSPFGNSNTGDLLNGASFADTGTPLLGGVVFDGNNDFVAVGNSSDINVGTFNKRSVSIWFKTNDITSNNAQILFEEGGDKKGLSIYLQNGNLYVGGWNTSDGWGGTFLSTDSIQADTWHHVGLVLDADSSDNLQVGAFRAYLDGTNFGQGDGQRLSSHGNPAGIGGLNSGGRLHTGSISIGGEVPNFYALDGTIADVRLYNRALNNGEMGILASEIDTISNQPSTDDLVMQLAFDDGTGTLATDTSPSGNNNVGTLLNGASFVDTGNPLAGVVQLDGIDDFVAVDNSSDINGSTFNKRTISAWFKVDDVDLVGQKQVIFEEGGGKKGLNIYVDNGQLYVGGWNQSDGWFGTFLSTDAISSDTWHHVALVLDANTSNNTQAGVFKAYLDGVQYGAGEGVRLTSHTNPIGIGAVNSAARFHTGETNGSGTEAFAGNIGDVLLYNRALDINEIVQLASTLSGGGDAVAPTAALAAVDLTIPGDTVYTFSVNYSDNVAIDVFSLDSNDLTVVGPNGFNQTATLVNVVNGTTNGTLRTATYQITAPGADWDIADNGLYEIFLEAGQVSDTSGNFAFDGSLGTFTVDIQPISSGQSILFPSGAGVIDVITYGAIANDGIDDTAAIQQALNENFGENYVFYFRDGVYDISDTLVLGGSEKRATFQGQSQDGTILRLMDSVSPEFNGALIRTGGVNGNNTADRFSNSIRNMTLSTGIGHANATGLQFWANNQGVVQDVTILSEDGQGLTGLDMAFDDGIGPLYVNRVTIDGFDYGIQTRWQTASQTFENITLKNQNIYGWWNTTSQRVFARNVTSINSVTAIRNEFEAGMVLDNAVLTGTGADVPAIYNQKSFYARNVQTSGYSLGIDNSLNFGRGNPDVAVGYIDEYWANGSGDNRSGGPFELFNSPDQMLNLPVLDTPDIPWDTDFSNWANPGSFVIGTSGIANDDLDDTAAIQAAIDSGATTIYLSQGNWTLDSELVLRGNVVRFFGAGAILEAGSGGVIRVADGSASTVVIERLEGLGRIEHESDRTLVLNNLLGFEYEATASAPGDVFINDSVGRSATFRNQNVWARQLNLESDTQSDPTIEAKVLNDNSQVWILGLKTEDEGTVIKTINGGATELLGALHIGAGVSNVDNPRYVTIDSSFSVAGNYGGGFSVLASETRNGETRTTTSFNFADVYTAYLPSPEPAVQLAFNGNIVDSSVNTYDVTASGGATFVAGAPDSSQALSLNGTNQFVRTSDFLSPSQQLTLTTWVKGNSSAWDTTTALVAKGNAFRLETVAGTQQLRFSIRESQTGGPWQTVEFDLAGLSGFTVADWHHYAASYDSSTGLIQLYIDGVLRATTDLSGAATPVQVSSDIGAMTIGYSDTLNTYFGGAIDDVRLYDRALTGAEIFNLANPL